MNDSVNDDQSDDSSDLDVGVPHTIKYYPRNARQKPPSSLALKRANLLFTMENERYRIKCRKLERFMKDLVLESAALCDEVARVQEAIFVAKEERRFLLKRLLQHSNQRDLLTQATVKSTPPPPSTEQVVTAASTVSPSVTTWLENIDKAMKKKTPSVKRKKEGGQNGAGVSSEDAPKKQKKKKPVTDKRLVPPIPLDSTGRPIFPIVLPGLKLHSLGEIIADRANFHSEDHIYPAGYCSSRVYISTLNPNHTCIYTCTILDGGAGPQFQLIPEDNPEQPFIGTIPDECQVRLVQVINQTCGKEVIPPEPRGADFFGLSHPVIKNLIQSCPGARKCSKYKWVKYEISKSSPDDSEQVESDPYLSCKAFEQLYTGNVIQKTVTSAVGHIPVHVLGVTIKQEPLEDN